MTRIRNNTQRAVTPVVTFAQTNHRHRYAWNNWIFDLGVFRNYFRRGGRFQINQQENRNGRRIVADCCRCRADQSWFITDTQRVSRNTLCVGNKPRLVSTAPATISHNTSTVPVFLLINLETTTTAKIIAEYSQIENPVVSCIAMSVVGLCESNNGSNSALSVISYSGHLNQTVRFQLKVSSTFVSL